MNAFNTTGTTHIIAISGFNITIIVAALDSIRRRLFLPKKASFIIIISGIFLFTILTGASASVIRAAVMGALVLIARQLGRQSQITSALLFTACVMIFLNPMILRFDVGFQLSFLSTLGLVYLSPLILSWFFWLPKISQEPLALTLSAQVLSLPIILYNFGRLSFISLLANVLILPIIPITMLLGFLSGILGVIYISLGQILGWFSWIFLSYTIFIVSNLAELPYASVNLENTNIIWFLIYYLLLILAIIWYRKVKNKREKIEEFLKIS